MSEGKSDTPGYELEEEAMKTNNRTIALRVVGTVIAGFLAVGISAGPSSVVSGGSHGSSVVADTGWRHR